MSSEIQSNSILTTVKHSYQAFLDLSKSQGRERSQGVQAMAKSLRANFQDILEANTLDLESSRETAVSELILEWLKLTPQRITNAVEILERIAELSDPLQQVMDAPYQLNPSQTYCQRMPLGVIALVYEAFPELAAIAAGLCLKTGNSLILRGTASSHHSNRIIAQILQNALEDSGLPGGCLEILESDQGSSIQELVSQDQYISLVIPSGRPSLITSVIQWATAPVLRTAMGNCYLYWAISGNLDLTRWMILDSHASEPDAVNALEKVLISPQHNASTLARLFSSLLENGFELFIKNDEVKNRVNDSELKILQNMYL
jgi:glutamate-5-semialdehyde dehydrogenase